MSTGVLQSTIEMAREMMRSEDHHQPGNLWSEFDTKINMFGVNVKEEPADDQRNDSGVTSGSDCPSASPGSDRSDTHHTPNNIYPFPPRDISHFPSSWPPMVQSAHQTHSDRRSISPKMDPDDNSNEFDDDGIRAPKINSHGKVKVHKCKQCEFVAYTKLEFWEHSKVHIKGDKILKCPKCPFVTEYKHHLEYHILNHAGAKPFKCQHCDYSCVNKSMLNSHLKSHSKVYQYRCANCHYETKYCHSLKLHLRKYGHKPAMVLNPDGSPNPLPIIDVYGTRRGPKIKKDQSSPTETVSEQPQNVPMMGLNPLLNPLLSQNTSMLPPFPLPLIPGFPGAMPNPELVANIQNLVRERLEELAKHNSLANNSPYPQKALEEDEEADGEVDGALDLTNKSNHSSEHSGSDNEEDTMTVAFDNVEVVQNKSTDHEVTLTPEIVRQTDVEGAPQINNNNNNKYEFNCRFCDMCFGDEVMYRIHMGYHGEGNPFNCKMCGEACENKVSFFWHIARVAH
ncbi:protein hunchback [Anthonomus grandis grandis]|uniref:protein hunchback n=1 Tax=Anthonomus grandis grandis TaxID=2921223 RepID=UPI0021663C4F|nr:protein hunchback [Anthonomus grandis grandis]